MMKGVENVSSPFQRSAKYMTGGSESQSTGRKVWSTVVAKHWEHKRGLIKAEITSHANVFFSSASTTRPTVHVFKTVVLPTGGCENKYVQIQGCKNNPVYFPSTLRDIVSTVIQAHQWHCHHHHFLFHWPASMSRLAHSCKVWQCPLPSTPVCKNPLLWIPKHRLPLNVLCCVCCAWKIGSVSMSLQVTIAMARVTKPKMPQESETLRMSKWNLHFESNCAWELAGSDMYVSQNNSTNEIMNFNRLWKIWGIWPIRKCFPLVEHQHSPPSFHWKSGKLLGKWDSQLDWGVLFSCNPLSKRFHDGHWVHHFFFFICATFYLE